MFFNSTQSGNVAQLVKPIGGFADDYAFLIRGLLDLYEAGFEAKWIEWALDLQEQQVTMLYTLSMLETL